MHLAIPFSALEPYKELAPNFKSKPMIDRTIGPKLYQEQLGEFVIELSVELGRAQMTVRELLALEPGAVLMLDRPAEEPWF